MQTLKFDINGMTCGGCTGGVTRALNAIDGIQHVEVSLRPGSVTLEADTTRVTPAQIEAVISNLGFPAKLRPVPTSPGS